MRRSAIGIWILALAVAATAGCLSGPKKRPSEPVVDEAAADPEVFAVVTARSLNVRGGPGPSHAVTGKLAKGARVRVLGEQGDWRRVQASDGGAEGWVSRAYLATEE